MIVITHNIGDTTNLRGWLETHIRNNLRPDVSNYAKGRLRVWLDDEPSLTANVRISQGLRIPAGIRQRLRDLIKWDFDYALVTYSGDFEAIGIKPHRDARYADYEAVGLNVSGTCRFDYWAGRQSFGKSPNLIEYDPRYDAPTDCLNLAAGDVVKFNCKNLHSATPSKKRWNINFWRKAPQVRL
jgi:hypothetical protein